MENNNEYRVRAVNITFLATVFISVFASLIIGIICKGLNVIAGGLGTRLYAALFEDYFVTLLFSQLLLFLPTFIFIILNRKYFFGNLRIRKLQPKTYGLVAAFGLFFIPIIGFINSISLLFTENVMQEEISGVVNEHSLLASLIVIAVVPCILEETIYRGVFYNEYSRINPLKAMFLTALLFGLLHMNLNQFMYAAVGGFVFAIMVEATGSITSSVIMHFMINGSSTLVSYFSSDILSASNEYSQDIGVDESVQGFEGAMSFMNNLSPMQQAVVSIGIIAIICTVFEIVIFIQILLSENRMEYFKNLFKRKASDIEGKDREEPKMVDVFLIIAMIVCVIVILLRHVFGV